MNRVRSCSPGPLTLPCLALLTLLQSYLLMSLLLLLWAHSGVPISPKPQAQCQDPLNSHHLSLGPWPLGCCGQHSEGPQGPWSVSVHRP